MKTKYKYILLGIVGLLLMALVLIIGLRTLVMSIANQRTCEWANIDNIELNARIDVPLIIDSDCEYLETAKIPILMPYLIKTKDNFGYLFSTLINKNRDGTFFVKTKNTRTDKEMSLRLRSV
tara:strand:+ start:4568 stop:4933 length:366 start_codon:yes stop_codon:yes gene_type:complete